MKKVLLALGSSLLASFASANPVTIDPDGIAEGTDLTNAFSGVTLRHITVVTGTSGQELVVDSVYAKECTSSDPYAMCSALGSGHFGYQTTTGEIAGSFVSESSASIYCITNNPSSCKWSPHHFLDVTFDSPVQSVTINAAHRSDWPWAWAFDAAGNLLQVDMEHDVVPGPSFDQQTMTVTPMTGQISRVVFAGLGGYVQLDKLTYTVP